MQLAFDHLVHFLRRSPQEAVEEMKRMGFHAVSGGRHENWGTHNSLLYTDVSYIEFLSVEHMATAERSDNPLIRQLVDDLGLYGEGLGQIAFRTWDIERVAEDLKRCGLRVTGPVPGSRKREDGSVIRWHMLFAESDEVRHTLPFFIQWAQSDEERRRDLTARGVIRPHPNSATRLEWIAYAVSDLDQTAARWKKWFGFDAGETYLDEKWQAKCRMLACPGGNILLCSPVAHGRVAEQLERRGERPFQVAFAGAGFHVEELLFGSEYKW